MIVTFMDLKTYFGEPYLNANNEPQYTFLLGIAEEEVLEYAGLEPDGGTVNEYFTESGAHKIQLKRKPILEVTAVTVDGESVDYRYDARTGFLYFKGYASGDVVVTETLGFGTSGVPGVIRKAIAETTKYWVKMLNNNMVGVTSRTSDLGTETIEQYEIPLYVKNSLERFRNQVVV